MKKGLKVLSAVLALSMGLVSASLVSAMEPITKAPTLSKGAQELLKVAQESAKKTNPFYTKWSDAKEYQDALKQADKAYEGVKADSVEWGRLSTLACEALREIESIDNQLAAVPHLKALAADTVSALTAEYSAEVVNATKEEGADDSKVIKPDAEKKDTLTIAKDKLVHESDMKALKELVAENQKLAAKETLKTEKTGLIAISKTDEGARLVETAKEAKKLVEKINSQDYQDAAAYVSKFTDDMINDTVINQLKANKVQLNAVVAFVAKIAKDNGLTLADCALPENATANKADEKVAKAEAKKDAVPDTGAFFKPLVPAAKTMKVMKKAEKKAEMKSAFSFEGLVKADLLG